MASISKRRKEVLAEYGVPNERERVARQKKVKKQYLRNINKFDSDNTGLPVHSPIRYKKDWEEQKVARALRDKPKLNLTDEDRKARKKASEDKKQQEMKLSCLGMLSAAGAKKFTRDAPSLVEYGDSWAYFNGLEGGIEENHHNKVSPFDYVHTNLIEENPVTGALVWHGQVCSICTEPPKDLGEVMLAQYGLTEFICVDCGRFMEHKGTGMRGYMSGVAIDSLRHKAKKPTTIYKHHLAKEDEEDE